MANSIGDWFKRYWVWITLVVIGLVAFLVMLLLPTGNTGALKVLKEAEDAVKELKEKKAAELKAIDDKLEANTNELVAIKQISDEEERLQKLADFANRRKKS